ncbi:MAG TPA: helix-turn-helix domain-containing protein [Candidatus Paceibacterota bacterium]|nr:helix-turn-helix domain-containing protein [Candidatus Paceibacterota bacterium]
MKERLERIEVEEPVHIPNLDGIGIAETIQVKVPAWRDPKDGEVYLDAEATAMLDKVKARHMGLLLPEQIKALRKRLGLTQPQISEMLQIGEKTWTRWETGRERPSRVINVLLFALSDGKLDAGYLHSVARRRSDWAVPLAERPCAPRNPWLNAVQEMWQGWQPEEGQELAQAIQEAIAGWLISRGKPGDVNLQMEAKITFMPATPPNVITVHSMKQAAVAGHGVQPTKPDALSSRRFEIPDEALIA